MGHVYKYTQYNITKIMYIYIGAVYNKNNEYYCLFYISKFEQKPHNFIIFV